MNNKETVSIMDEEFEYVLRKVPGLDISGSNSTTDIPDAKPRLFIAKIIVQAIILGLAIFGNTCLIITMRIRKRNFTRMHIFIMHLCFADLMVALFNILPQLVWDIVGKWIAGDFMCRLIKFLQIFVMYVSTYILVLTAIDRRRAICSPLTSHTWTFRLVHLSVGVVYILSAVLSIPQAIMFKYQAVDVGKPTKNCWVNFQPFWTLHAYITSFTVVIYVIPLGILVYSYGSIYVTIFKRHKQSKADFSMKYRKVKKQEGKDVDDNESDHLSVNEDTHKVQNKSPVARSMIPRSNSCAGFSRAKLKTVKLTFVIILAYIACWSPFFISHLWWLYDESAPHNNDAVVIMVLLASLNSCCNPWIYMVCSGSFSLHPFTSTSMCCGNQKSKQLTHTDGLAFNRIPKTASGLGTPTNLSTSRSVLYSPVFDKNCV